MGILNNFSATAICLACLGQFSFSQDASQDENSRFLNRRMIQRFESLQEKIKAERYQGIQSPRSARENRQSKNTLGLRGESFWKTPTNPPPASPTGPVSNSNSGTATPAYRTKQDPSVNLGIVATQSGRPNPGLIIEKVAANSPAAAAGLKTADRIVAFGGASIGKIADLQMILTALAPGDRAVIEFFRDNQNKNALVEFPLKPSLRGPKQPTNKTGPPANNELLPAPLNSTPQVNPTPPDNLDKNASRVTGKSSGSVVNKAGLGVVAVTVDPVIAQLKGLSVRQGAMLDDVLVNSAADTAGLRKGDTVIAMDGRRVNSALELAEIIQMYKPGENAEILFYQGNRLKKTTIVLESKPASELIGGLPEKSGRFSGNSKNPVNDPSPSHRRVLEGWSNDFPRLKRVEDLVQRLTPLDNENRPNSGNQAQFEKRNRESELLGLRKRILRQDQKIQQLTEKIGALEKLLSQEKQR